MSSLLAALPQPLTISAGLLLCYLAIESLAFRARRTRWSTPATFVGVLALVLAGGSLVAHGMSPWHRFLVRLEAAGAIADWAGELLYLLARLAIFVMVGAVSGLILKGIADNLLKLPMLRRRTGEQR